MRWLLRKSCQAALVGGNSFGLSKFGFNGVRRSVVTSCRGVLLPRFGGADVLELRDNVSVPDLKPNEVLVRARAVSVNPLDCRMREGYGRSLFEPLLPLILGRDISGEVAAVGSSVSSLSVGQEVFGALHPTAVRGTYVDYAILAEDELISKPESISHVEASAVPFAALTAWRALRSTANIKKGQRILVVGGGGAVGFSAIQLAVAAGCHVSTICGNECLDRILAAGAEQTVDYTTENYESSIKGYFDAVLDTIGAPETERIGVGHLKRGGHYMTLQGEAASISDMYGMLVGLPVSTALLIKKQMQYRYSHGIEYHWTYMRADAEGLEEIRRLCEGGKLKVPVETTFPITQKLISNGSKNHFSKHSSKPDEESERNIIGKRKERSDEESQASKPHPLIPTSLDCSLTNVVAMDCEMVGVSSTRNKSALGRVTMVNSWGNVIYDEYVRPMAQIVDFRTEISGIRPRDLKSAKNFNLVQNKVAEMIHERILVGHALRHDLKALLLSHPKKDKRDTAEYAPFLKEGRSRSLKNLAAQFLSVEIQNGEHCPVEDARAAMLLYQKNRKQWERSAKDFIRLKEKQKKRKHKKTKVR